MVERQNPQSLELVIKKPTAIASGIGYESSQAKLKVTDPNGPKIAPAKSIVMDSRAIQWVGKVRNRRPMVREPTRHIMESSFL